MKPRIDSHLILCFLIFEIGKDKHTTPAEIDNIISAAIPDVVVDPDGYVIVAQFMMHGPCGNENHTAPCMNKDGCSKRFPKEFSSQTNVDDNGFPIYRRRDDGIFVEKSGIKLDN